MYLRVLNVFLLCPKGWQHHLCTQPNWDATAANGKIQVWLTLSLHFQGWKCNNSTDTWNFVLFTSNFSLIDRNDECLTLGFFEHCLPFFSLCLCVQVTQHGCCMTHTASLWTWPPSLQRRKAWWWIWLPSRRRRRRHRWGVGNDIFPILTDCLNLAFTALWGETPLHSVLCPLPWVHYFASCQRSPVLHCKWESGAVHLLFK